MQAESALLRFEPGLMIWTIGVFVTLLVVLRAVAWKPLLAALDEREKKIHDALDQARARYLPVVDFAARYTAADGGRTIDFPAGDLLNPVYARLDEMLIAEGQPPRFARVGNQQIELLRSREQETKLVLEQPIYEPRLGPSVEAGRQDLARAEADLAALRARVVRDMRQAYYQWLATQQAVVVFDATLQTGTFDSYLGAPRVYGITLRMQF